MDLTVVSANFPERPQPELDRAHFVNTLRTLLMGANDIVCVEGEENIGKTTLLAQLARTLPNHTISVFVSPSSRLTFDPDLIRLDLASQVNWLLNKTPHPPDPLDG